VRPERSATPRSSAPPAVPAGGRGAEARFRGYFLPEDIAADRWVHLAALVLSGVGVPCLLAEAARVPGRAMFIACAIYSATLVALFVGSTLFYHVPLRIERRRLRQLDHAAIFLLIAGTYTPFTVALLHGGWAVGVTALVWSGAIAGAIYKLARPLAFPGFSRTGYLLLGGTTLTGLDPVLNAVDPASLVLIVAGLAIIILGAMVRVRRSLRYRNTIWHIMVTAGALCHYAAILHVVLAGTTA
jgi:hemolysin III